MTIKKISDYKTLVFDCDGVVLDSNRIKTDAFYQTTRSYGEDAAGFFVEYHRQHGGISRYRKFEYFFTDIVRRKPNVGEMESLLATYASHVRDGLLSCDVTEGLKELRAATPDARWLIVSGGDQTELRHVFKDRGLAQFFDGGIYGAPDSKDEILARESDNGNIQPPGLFIGDSRYDHQASTRAGLDFLFVTRWTEFSAWQEYFQPLQIACLDSIGHLGI